MNFDKSLFTLDHIGIAVKSLSEGRKFYEALGMIASAPEEVKSEQVRVLMFESQNGSRLELLEPTGEESPIARFLEKRGPGIHHVCLGVKDLEQRLHELKQKGVRLINEKPKRGAHNCLVAFIHPSSTGGVLVELSQPLEGKDLLGEGAP